MKLTIAFLWILPPSFYEGDYIQIKLKGGLHESHSFESG